MDKVKCREYMEYLEKLYFTLRDMKAQKREHFNQNEYKWVLGADVISTLGLRDGFIISEKAPTYLFGIVVEIDYCNIYNVQIFEDITNKIAIDYGDTIKLDKLEQIEKIVKQVESKHPEIAIGDREGIRKIREVLDNDASRKKS